MSRGELLPRNPAALAESDAIASFQRPTTMADNPEDRSVLRRLDAVADELAFIDSPYWVEANRGFSIPASFEASEEVPVINFFRMSFEGTFVCYSKVMIGKIIGVEGGSVDALCLTFNQAMVLPQFERLPEQDLLYVPVLAVDAMDAL